VNKGDDVFVLGTTREKISVDFTHSESRKRMCCVTYGERSEFDEYYFAIGLPAAPMVAVPPRPF
jgi:hypothetical protein